MPDQTPPAPAARPARDPPPVIPALAAPQIAAAAAAAVPKAASDLFNQPLPVRSPAPGFPRPARLPTHSNSDCEASSARHPVTPS
ncbi:MAG: hypothetical protein ACKVHO_05960, partial [Verrucomicrobiia bacterium]